jgi:hypothetical protein
MADGSEPVENHDPYRFEARLASADRSPGIAVAIVVLGVGLAILKPWAPAAGPGDGRSGAAPGSTFAPAGQSPRAGPSSAQPRPSPSPSEAVLELCHDPGSWRTATIETWHDQRVRVWRALDPGPASGPLDASIQIVPAVGVSVPAIGFCAPTSGPDRPGGAAKVSAWRVDDNGARVVGLRQVAPIVGTSPFGALYGAPYDPSRSGGLSRTPEGWPAGLIVFRYVERATGAERWFGIDVNLSTGPLVTLPDPP